MESYVVWDLANAFFSICLAAKSLDQFASTWNGHQWTSQVLTQGCIHRPPQPHLPWDGGPGLQLVILPTHCKNVSLYELYHANL